MKESREDHKKIASMLLKMEYVIVLCMGMKEYGTFLCASKLLWVYEVLQVLKFCYQEASIKPSSKVQTKSSIKIIENKVCYSVRYGYEEKKYLFFVAKL